MARRRREEEHENHERWLVSYADFITLLFAFFVVMYSISSLNEGKYKVLSQTLVAAFTGQPNRPQPIEAGQAPGGPPRVVDLPPLPRPSSLNPVPAMQRGPRAASQPEPGGGGVQQRFAGIAQAMAERLRTQVGQGQVQVRLTPQGVAIDIHDNLLFASGQATLAPTARALLLEVARELVSLPYQFQVNGYTDDQPISNAQFQSNWELSAMRAVSVLNMLTSQGVPAGQLIAAGYGQYHPVASNATAAGRAANRRVSIVIVSPEQASAADPGRVIEPAAAAEPPSTRP